MENKSNGYWKIPVVIGVLLLLAAIGLALYNFWDANRAAEASREILDQLQVVIENTPQLPEEPEAPEEETEEEKEYELIDGMWAVKVDKYSYIATLAVPEMQLEVPVMSKWDYTRLRVSPCRYSGSYVTNDLVICAHNYAKHFNRLLVIEPGTEVILTTTRGEVIRYEVTEVGRMEPDQTAEMIENRRNSTNPANWDMTLFTCYPGGETRRYVRCKRILEAPVA